MLLPHLRKQTNDLLEYYGFMCYRNSDKLIFTCVWIRRQKRGIMSFEIFADCGRCMTSHAVNVLRLDFESVV